MRPLLALRNAIMERSRARKLDHFYSLAEPGPVLDVGVAGFDPPGSPLNVFPRTFRWPAELYTGLGVQYPAAVARHHPGKLFVQYSGGTFPFRTDSFDWVFSNAVIEHVGSSDDQLLFLNEMLRVGKRVFFTTPNKYFLIETHTRVPLLHWKDAWFFRWCARYRPAYNADNLRLLWFRDLERLLRESSATKWSIQRNRFAGTTMTFSCVCRAERTRDEVS